MGMHPMAACAVKEKTSMPAHGGLMNGLCSNIAMWKKAQESKGRTQKEEFRLLDYHALPDYLKDNEYILSYYRADFSFTQALSSLFKMHNETLNVWTHLLGFLLFAGFTIMAVMELREPPSSVSRCVMQGMWQHNQTSKYCALEGAKESRRGQAARWPMLVFLGGAMFCMLASAACHLLTCQSREVSGVVLRVDYAGIAVMIATSFFPPVYYALQCAAPAWQWVYLGGISCMGTATVAVLCGCHGRAFRTLLLAVMGLSGLVPAAHGLLTTWHEPWCGLALAYESSMAAAYALGTLIYVSRVPERWKPGSFDLAGHSHNLFHVLVLAGAYAHYRFSLLLLEWRDSHGCTAPSLI